MTVVNQFASVVVDTTRSPFARHRMVPVRTVRLNDEVWAPRIRTNREVSIPRQLELLEQSGRLPNFRKAAGKLEGQFEGIYFNDSDVYKWLEAASWSLSTDPDPVLEHQVEAVIREVADAQQPNGYLDNFYVAGEDKKRWTELKRTHELYCAGHLIQAAVAHHRATGKTSLLDIARRFADHICDEIGPAEEGKRPGTDGHPIIEMAMVELARETGEQRYLDQASYLLDARGHGLAGGDEYRQDHKPFRELDTMVGHAVRIIYLNSGAADLYAETGDETLLAALERLWENATTKRMYLTGGLGARHDGEAFGADYELPNDRAYTETCAAIGSIMWNWRMLMLTGEAKYGDLMEWTLYNAFLSGVSVDGLSYFYVNPLADEGGHRRQTWFECSCCPPNIARTFASLPGYFYSIADDGIFVHLYGQGTADIALPDGRSLRLRQRTEYPYDGNVTLGIESAGKFTLSLRIPGWCAAGATVMVNSEPVSEQPQPGSYLTIERDWSAGDQIRLSFPMPVQLVEAHPHLLENTGRWAVTRGPLVYCIEQADHPGVDIDGVTLLRGVEFSVESRPSMLGGIVALTATALEQRPASVWDGKLYLPAGDADSRTPAFKSTIITAIPYHTWANREAGPMRVWLRHN